jgi:hypothetical protein
MKLLDTSSWVPQKPVTPSHLAGVQRRKNVVHRAPWVAPRCVQPWSVRERGLGQPRPPGCNQRSGRDPHPHTRPPPCGLPVGIRPNPKQPSRHSACFGAWSPSDRSEDFTVAGRRRDHGPARRCARSASCTHAADSGSIGRVRHDPVGRDRHCGEDQRHTHPARRAQQRSGTATGRSTTTRRGLRRGPGTIPPEPGSHHNELTEQHLATHRCR